MKVSFTNVLPRVLKPQLILTNIIKRMLSTIVFYFSSYGLVVTNLLEWLNQYNKIDSNSLVKIKIMQISSRY